LGRSGPGRIIAIVFSLVLVGLVTWLLWVWFMAAADTPQTSFAHPASDIAESIQGVYEFVFWLAAGVFVVIMTLTLAFSLMFRERPGEEARQFHGNPRLEVLWTLVPVGIVVAMAVPTFQVIAEMHQDPADVGGGDVLEVVAIGHQWWFEFQYPELDIVTANELYIPVDRPVSITLQSVDVIHSFWVPRLAGKVDMIPGHSNHLWFTPQQVQEEPYLGQCAEFCGLSHANMRFRVFVRSQGDFDDWVQRQQEGVQPEAEAAIEGQQQFTQSGCVGCHTVRGNEAAVGVVGPDLTNFGERWTLGSAMMDNTEANLRAWLRDPQAVKPGNRMPNLNLSEEAIDRLVAYLMDLQ
jgi:cytochrome c oxidase subunit II